MTVTVDDTDKMCQDGVTPRVGVDCRCMQVYVGMREG